jgi:hypothetical protein
MSNAPALSRPSSRIRNSLLLFFSFFNIDNRPMAREAQRKEEGKREANGED